MKIVAFSVRQLHGFLDIDMEFNDDLTIIVGRNGSGKTSALNLISDLIRLDTSALRRVPFGIATVSLVDDSMGEISVSASNSEEVKSITLTIQGESTSLPLDLPVELYTQLPNGPRVNFYLREFWSASAATAASSKKKTIQLEEWTILVKRFSESTKLTFVRLDRTIVAVDPDGTERSEAPKGKPGRPATTDPIDEVLRVTTQRYGEYKRKVEDIKNTAFNELLQLHFEPIRQVSPRTKSGQAQLKTKVQQLRRRVENSALFADSPSVQTYTSRFFESFSELLFESPSAPHTKKKIGRRTLQEESAQILLNLKERQIEELLKIFEREQEQAQHAYLPIRRYIDTTMKFLRESGKSLEFDASLQLGFRVPSAPGTNTAEANKQRSLKELASGERQVIIVLTYLAFLAGQNSIFIIDEPELSLHLRWQGYLVEALKQLRPNTCQIIIATHAPEIAGRAKSRIKLLKPSYLPSDAE